ncbi:MAG: DNA double-strand break repair nuclease NurA [Chloroflexi bacterium]|nr:DNA double-strand break repair nuclease NurA [Chloroflexota bacterium]
MPLLAPVIEAARTRRETIKGALQPAQLAAWRSIFLSRWWLPLPPNGEHGPARRSVHVAVDGTGHSVELSTGAHFVLAAAAAAGPPPVGQHNAADMEVIPARYEQADAATARDLMMQLLEVFMAAEAASVLVQDGLAPDAILWLDGSIYGSLAHLAGAPGPLFDERDAYDADAGKKTRWAINVQRAINIVQRKAELLDLTERSGLWLIGLAKTQRASFLFDALAATPEGLTRAPHERAADGELLAAAPLGFSWPVVLDGRSFQAIAPAARVALAETPAIVSCYVRPHAADLPLRVDVPASLVGLDDRLLLEPSSLSPRPTPAWVPDPKIVWPIIQSVVASYGGVHAYNAPLYAVDRLVRLSRRELETRYLPICAKVIGVDPRLLAVDRGRRRFLIA